MPKPTLICILAALAVVALAPGGASAADTVVVPIVEHATLAGVDTHPVTALDGTIVWRQGTYRQQTLMQRKPDGTIARVPGAPEALYFSIDLGHDADGHLVLTYIRCTSIGRCKAYSDDLAGHRVTFKVPGNKRCDLTAAPARWGNRVAYSRLCAKLGRRAHVDDLGRSGLFVRKGTGAPRRLRIPASDDTAATVRWVDLRGTTVGAAAADSTWHVFEQTVNGTRLRSTVDDDAQSGGGIAGLALGARGALWTLSNISGFPDNPNSSLISRLVANDCAVSERLVNPPAASEPAPFPYPVETIAVDGDALYLFVAGTGIVRHEFSPKLVCP